MSCSSNCECSDEAFNPVCGSDGVEFRSPCHAGCLTMETDSNQKTLVRAGNSFEIVKKKKNYIKNSRCDQITSGNWMASCLSPFSGKVKMEMKRKRKIIFLNKSAFWNIRKWKCKVGSRSQQVIRVWNTHCCCSGLGSCVGLKQCTLLRWLWQKSMANDVESWLDSAECNTFTLPLKCCSNWKRFQMISGKY